MIMDAEPVQLRTLADRLRCAWSVLTGGDRFALLSAEDPVRFMQACSYSGMATAYRDAAGQVETLCERRPVQARTVRLTSLRLYSLASVASERAGELPELERGAPRS